MGLSREGEVVEGSSRRGKFCSGGGKVPKGT